MDRANQTVEYEYDKNGNLKKNLNKDISLITYNPLNLPSVITFSGNKSITYGYDAAGSKLSVAYLSDGVTSKIEYAGNKVYNNGTLSTLLTEEGYIEPGTTPTYHYYLKDHQGNNRVVVNQTGTVQQVNHYYPFGGLFGEGLQNSNQRYKYNGKEIDRSFALDMYDYGARHYDATLGRWFTVDPLAEKYYSISPYVYVGNNPINFIDPNGMDIWEIDIQGKIKDRIKDEGQDAFIMLDADGNRTSNSISFKFGTVKHEDKYDKDGNLLYDKFTISKESASSAFEFLADNTNVEWGLAEYRKGDSKILTSHDESSLSKGLLDAEIYSDFSSFGNNYSFIHSHPGGIPYPSGLYNRKFNIGEAKKMQVLGFVKFQIYLPGTNGKYVRENYIQYNSRSIYQDFRGHPWAKYARP